MVTSQVTRRQSTAAEMHGPGLYSNLSINTTITIVANDFLTHSVQFVDLCILLGCDYSGKIRGLGPKKALRMMQEHGSIERILGALSPQKQTFSGDFPYVAVRQLFLQPDVVDVKSVELSWQEVNKETVVQFLTNEKHIKKIDVRLDKLCATGQSKKRKHVTAPVSPSSNKQKKMTHYYAVKKSVT